MKSKKILSLLLAGVMTTALLAVPAQAASSAVQVGSYKGNTLNVGEISGLMIYPSTAGDSVVSSDPDVVRVGNVLGRWTATAQGPGTAAITVTAPDGQTGSVTITVEPAKSAVSDKTEDTAADAYSEVRQKLVRLINQTRAANGVSELPVNDALMSAAQACSDRRYTWHHTKEECEAVIASGYPHGFGTNLTVFTGVAAKDTAQHALENWISSPGHFETMIEPDCDGIGVGVTESGGVTYCYMFAGRPNTQNPYE